MRDRLVADGATLTSKQPSLKLQLLCDGAPERWNLLDQGFTQEKFGADIHRLVDLHHLAEKLGAAARAIAGPAAAGDTLTRWKLALLNRGAAATDILAELVASNRENTLVGEDRLVHAAITYLQSHSEDADRMNYARARRLGWPSAAATWKRPAKASSRSA